jgi:ATP-dependent DNA helicase RecG
LVFKDRKEFTGSLFEQLAEVYKTIDFYNGTMASFHDLLRTDERDYPEDAVREALLNAIVHRDYSFSGSTFINLYSDRLEFISLGGLVPGLSLEAAMLGASQSRNEKLAIYFIE